MSTTQETTQEIIDAKKLAWRFAHHIYKVNKVKIELEKSKRELKETQRIVLQSFAPLSRKSYDVKALLNAAINNPDNAKEIIVKYAELKKEYEKEKELIRQQVQPELTRIRELNRQIKELESRLFYHIEKANEDVVSTFSPSELEKEQ